ncbi:MAG: restriction endonuclease [Thermoproteota archaeon]|nr:restriction endonuclease [Thermoproteota archaeon]
MSGVELENQVAEAFQKQGYIVFKRTNHCDVLAVKPDLRLAYLVECKDYVLSKKQQRLAVRELNRNYTHALELLLRNRLFVEKILKVLVAQGFSYQARNILQYTPAAFVEHVLSTNK